MNYSNLMDAVNARIKANGRREITGDILNDVLRAMVVELGASYQLGGTIRPGDKPKGEDLRVAYLAVEPGMYLYAGGFEVTELSLITYGAEWHMYPLGVPFGTQIAEDIAAAVDAEKTRAMAAEKTLSDAIATEARERAAADSSLDSAIKAEAKRASDAEGVLTKAVEDEKARAMAAEGANASAITAEADARAKADTTLQGNINTEESERKAADQTLQDNINAEKTRATTAEATLTKNINTESVERKAADTALGTRVASIEAKIPAQATAENKLADKDFVNSSIATATATFRGTFDTLDALKAAQADKNDYAFWVHKDEVGNTCYDKYTYTGTEWLFEYRLNNSSFTAAQWAALNSGVTADVIKALQDADKANAKAIADEKVAREQADTTLQGNIDKKQNIIVDLPAIREESANGQTAFSWGDHAEAGYVKPFVITIVGDGTAENPYRVVGDIDVNKVQNALNAHNLILLNIDDTILPLTEAFRRAENVRGITLQFVTMYGDGYEREEYIINIAWDGVTIDYYDYMYVTYDQIQSEETERKAADQTLQSNINKKIEPFIINLSGDGSAENPYTVDKTREEVAAALAANSLILLKGEASDFPGYFEIYTLNWATNYPTQALMLQFGNIDEASLIYTTMVLVFSYQEGVGVNVMASSTKLATDEQVKSEETARKSADATLQSNIDKKVSKDDETWLENFMPKIILNKNGTVQSVTVGDNVAANYATISARLSRYGGVVIGTTIYQDNNPKGRVVQVHSEQGQSFPNVLYVTAIYNYGEHFAEAFANSIYEIVLNYNSEGTFVSGTYEFKPISEVFEIELERSPSGDEYYINKTYDDFNHFRESLIGYKSTPLIILNGTFFLTRYNSYGYGSSSDYHWVYELSFISIKDKQLVGYYIVVEKDKTTVTPFEFQAQTQEEIAAATNKIAELEENVTEINANFQGMSEFLQPIIEGLQTGKQDKLISGTNIKTINGESILGSGDLVVGASTMKAGQEPNSVYLEYEGLGGNNEPIFIDNDGTALTRGQICRLLADKSANQVVLINTAASDEVPREQTSTAKFLQVEEDAFIIGFVGANADGQIFDILYKWDATEAKVLRAELLYNPTA